MAKAPRKRVPGKQRAPGGARTRAASGGSKTRGPPQERALVDVADVLDKLDRPSAVIGGIAVIAWGYARFTADIDCAVGASSGESQDLLTQFERGGFEPRTDDAVAFAEQNLVLLLRHRKTGVEVDVSLAQLEFEGAALRAAVLKRFGSARIRVPTLTDLLIYKLVAGRPKDHEDVKELLALGYEVDAQRVETTLSAFDALLDTDRLADWFRLKGRR
ncbi:nucleotidyl transferase AbiEii/AbiGii toxin family protein [Archangium sp.]|uniref:nucleotidyl transferase AbiEii/AbiGii toxin family protein n=1 Tax=Archangium sp. TaxID=1872627 RepID=UPI00286AF9E9|nr:nucleotidyl transferase AbiEii/AbiGii toxin family protein [Archangium sp.]